MTAEEEKKLLELFFHLSFHSCPQSDSTANIIFRNLIGVLEENGDVKQKLKRGFVDLNKEGK